MFENYESYEIEIEFDKKKCKQSSLDEVLKKIKQSKYITGGAWRDLNSDSEADRGSYEH